MRRFFDRIGQALRRFMYGRYGSDQLNLVFLGLSIVCDAVYMFSHLWPFYIVSAVFLVLMILRMLSRNVQKRYNENQRFLNFFRHLKMLRHYHIYRCPQCRQKIRIPRKGGKRVEIRCPKCSTTFIKKI